MTTAAERLLAPGPEEQQLAERAMVGLYQREIMRPGDGNSPDFRRLDYQHCDRAEGRWKYGTGRQWLAVQHEYRR